VSRRAILREGFTEATSRPEAPFRPRRFPCEELLQAPGSASTGTADLDRTFANRFHQLCIDDLRITG
jgi:hypothetical protein